MKKEKFSFKKYIFPAIASVVVFALMVLLIVVTRKPEDAEAASVIVNGKTYSESNKMKILEILPDEAYDELGVLIGDDYGTLSWNKIKGKVNGGILYSTSEKNDDKQNQDYTAIKTYIQNVNDTFLAKGNHGYTFCVKNGDEYRYGTDFTSLFGKVDSVDVSKLQLALCQKDNDGKYKPVKTDDGKTDVRNIFGYFVFGNSEMENLMELRIMTPSQLNSASNSAEILDNSALIYFSNKTHTSETKGIYNYVTGKAWPSAGDQQLWSLDGNDLNADIALYLLMLNTRKGKAIMYNSTDKDKGTSGFSNISRVLLTISGIERNRFVADFAYKESVSSSRTSYSGNYGNIKIDNESGHKVVNYYKNNSDTEKSKWENKNGPFVYWDDYAKYVNPDYNWQPKYPLFNSSGQKETYLDKYAWEFPSDNSLTSDWLIADKYPDDAEKKDRELATTYQEAAILTKDNNLVSDAKLTGAKMIQYIIGAYKTAPKSEIKVLEIEPIGVYNYKQGYKTTVDNDYSAKIRTWFGLDEDESKSGVKVNVTSVSMNGFIGLNEDVLATYDLVIIGAQGGNKINTSVFGKLYNKGVADSDKNTYYNLNGNDFTLKAYNKIKKFAQKGMPIALDTNVYNGNTDYIDKSTKVYNLRIYNLMTMLVSTGYSNIVSIDSDITSSDILNYIVKPQGIVSPTGVKLYSYDENNKTASLNSRSVLEDLKFSGEITAKGTCSVDIYLDVDCDGIFSDDEKYYHCVRNFTNGVGNSFSTSDSDKIKDVPSNIPGYVRYKITITDSNELKYDIVNAFALKAEQIRTVKVLQIVPDKKRENDGSYKDNPSTLNITDSSKPFCKAFAKVEDITGLKLAVDKITPTEFSKGIANGTIDVDLYSMIVIGFSNTYGKIADDNGNEGAGFFSSQAVEEIKKYIKAGKSVLMTHDSLSYHDSAEYNKSHNSIVSTSLDQNSVLTKGLLSPSFIKYIGVQKSYHFTDALIYSLKGTTPYSWYDTFYSSQKSLNGKTKNTNQIAQLNSGEITSYPYAISDSVGNRIDVARTHAQYYPLELDEITDGKDVVVWYTLDDPSVTQENASDENSKEYKYLIKEYPHDGITDSNKNDASAVNASKGYFGYAGQDAVNNYYIYSCGNVTYSSAGHQTLNDESNIAEIQLFVNTFTRAILAGTVVPEVTYTDAQIDDTATKYRGFTKSIFSNFYNSKLTFSFKIEDADFDFSSSALLYLYDESNDDSEIQVGAYKEKSDGLSVLGKDNSTPLFTKLGYINVDNVGFETGEGKAKIKYSGRVTNLDSEVATCSIVSGGNYMVDNLWSIIPDSIKNDSAKFAKLKSNIKKGNVKIGILATNSKGAKGYALLKVECKTLFDLD
ncbi:MAG: DUF5057 domain-containing protein [Eubacterium sp.]|nr:DUF5057 domain-containing protein [Eubacterium sp.]